MKDQTAVGIGLSADSVAWQRFSVPYTYPVAFVRGLFRPENTLFADTVSYREPKKRHRCFIVVDAGLTETLPDLLAGIDAYFAAHADRLEMIARPMTVPGGEQVKNELTHIERLQDAIHRHNIDRHSYVVAIGGGAVLDAVGLAASTAHRGVRHIRVPTTVLSQNDSGVGVKNAVNLKGIKNYIGSFAPPWAVLNDYDFLDALPHRERRAGIAEAVKVALIRDRRFYDWLEANVDALAIFEPEAEQYMVRRSAELHMHQIAHGGDPFENGSARPLDYGHWSAHKLEAMTRNHVRHGEAVAMGVALDTRYSVLAGHLKPGAEERVAVLLEGLGLRIWHPALDRTLPNGELEILAGLREFLGEMNVVMRVSRLAKYKTTVQLIAMGALLVEPLIPDLRLIVDAILWLAALLTVWTGWSYWRGAQQHMREPRP